MDLKKIKKLLGNNLELVFSELGIDYQKNGRKMYFEKDGHMNEYGNQLVAKYLESYLLQ